MMLQFKLLPLVLIIHLVHSNSKDLEVDSTGSYASCIDSDDEMASDSNCYCYNQPEMNFEHSICVTTNDATTTTPKKCPVGQPFPKDNYRLVQEKCFYFERGYKNFEDAKENCKQMGGKLYEPENVVGMHHIARVAFGISNFVGALAWIGITDIESEGNFAYDSNGQSILFNPPWYPGYIFILGLL